MELHEAYQAFNPSSARYRKISLEGATVLGLINGYPNPKLFPKGMLVEFPMIDSNEPKGKVDEEIIRRNNRGAKSLLREYDESKLKNSEGMNVVGLDIFKLQCKLPEKHNRKQRINLSIKKIEASKYVRKSIEPKKRSKVSKDSLQPIESKNKSARLPRSKNEIIPNTHDEEAMEIALSKEMSESMTYLNKKEQNSNKKSILKKVSSILNGNDIIINGQECLTTREEVRLTCDEETRQITYRSKAKEYLYKRLEGSEKLLLSEFHYVYEKRIKSYLEFLWKNQFAHNIYINLDIKSDELNNRPRKLRAYVGPGNNGAMIKGLLKRRFWWSIVEEQTKECEFVWTQVKVNSIFEIQQKVSAQKARYKKSEEEISTNISNEITSKKSKAIQPVPEPNYNEKLMNTDDIECLKKFTERYEDKERDYAFKCDKVGKELLLASDSTIPILIHNHLPNNFYLGNKKALFHNLREYYTLQKKNVYNYIPLTFHIRKGTRDPEYARFVEYHRRRAKQILKEEQRRESEEEEENEEKQVKPKMRNIWIVKPGENSNQGRGITVIDEIYELNNIIKQSEKGKPKNEEKHLPKDNYNKLTKTNIQPSQEHRPHPNNHPKEETERTFIVQLYIDRPFLYNSRKFDLRHYMLITNFYGVTLAYWYEDGYIRTSSYEFDINNFEPEIHLTNDAVQKKYPDYHKYEPYNKLSYDDFQRYLDNTHSNKKLSLKSTVLPEMKKMACDTARSVYTKISPQNQLNNFEIFGLDFMIDRDFRPWLIEINTNPCLDCSCPLLDRIIPYMIEQSFKLTLDLSYPPPTHYPNTSKHLAPLINLETFKYELIFDSEKEGEILTMLYAKNKNNLIDQIGEIEEDEVFRDEGREIKLDDYF